MRIAELQDCRIAGRKERKDFTFCNPFCNPAILQFCNVVLVLLSLASALGAQTAAPATSAGAPPAPKGDEAKGKKLFDSYGCYQCHNLAAQGGSAGPRLAPRPIAFAAFSKYVRQPTADMPPYTAKVVSDQELADIYAFLAAIPPPPPIDSIPLLK